MKQIFKKIVFGLILTMTPVFASAATISLSLPSTSIKEGSTFTVQVLVNSEDKLINAVSGLVSFDKSILEATSLLKSESIISSWSKGPTRSNANGNIIFEGITSNDGYSGINGKLFTITFKAKKLGDTKLSITDGSVLQKDSTGGNILTDTLPVSIAIVDDTEFKAGITAKEKELGTSTNREIVINSSSHPDEEKWYSDNTPSLSFVLPEGTTEIKTLISNSKTKSPSILYKDPIAEKTIDTLSDGIYYFAISAKNSKGWSDVARRQIKIDTAPPLPFNISVADETRDKHLPPSIVFSTKDKISEDIKYEIKVGNSDVVSTTEHKIDNPYQIQPLNPGAYIATVSAYDEAGNVRAETIGFIVEAIATPKILKFPNEVISGTKERIKGITYPNTTVYFNYKIGEKTVIEENIKSNERGEFSMPVTKKLSSGVYILTVRVEDQKGFKSNETFPVIISFKPLYATTSFILYVVFSIIVIVSVSFAIIMWRKSDATKKKNKHKSKVLSKEAEDVTEKSFEILIEGVTERIATLKAMKPKRKYLDGEIAFLLELESDLLEAKVLIVEDIHKISKPHSK